MGLMADCSRPVRPSLPLQNGADAHTSPSPPPTPGSWRRLEASVCIRYLLPCSRLYRTRWLKTVAFRTSGFHGSRIRARLSWVLALWVSYRPHGEACVSQLAHTWWVLGPRWALPQSSWPPGPLFRAQYDKAAGFSEFASQSAARWKPVSVSWSHPGQPSSVLLL